MTAASEVLEKAGNDTSNSAVMSRVASLMELFNVFMVRLPQTVAAIGDGAVLPLLKTLGSSNPNVRVFAINSLALIGPAASAALPALKKISASDAHEGARLKAEDAIRKIQGSP